jgi:hypothetical protein
LIKVWFSASTFVVKIATFAKPETVVGNLFRTMKVSLTILLGLVFSYATGQQLNINYRTAIDSAERGYNLVFSDKFNCVVIFPIRGHGDAMFPQKRRYDLEYSIMDDTIKLKGTSLDTMNRTVNRLLKSKFIVTTKKVSCPEIG